MIAKTKDLGTRMLGQDSWRKDRWDRKSQYMTAGKDCQRR
jgi:hypothetical protein